MRQTNIDEIIVILIIFVVTINLDRKVGVGKILLSILNHLGRSGVGVSLIVDKGKGTLANCHEKYDGVGYLHPVDR